MNEQKRKRFEETLTKAFNHDRYVQFLRELLDNMQAVSPYREVKPWNTFSAAVDHYRHIGNYVGEDKNKVALFSVCLKNDKNLENARSMQRTFVKTLLENSDCAGALVAFYTAGDLDKWRLSLVRMDYEFSKGKLSEKLTPAKRYSYLVGKGEPCHTAQERLYPIFVEDDLNPSLDELEDAFSVEAVTKDFFAQYREKYLDLKEFLDSNPEFTAEAESRGFNSEQFAKKLMGQIVFLYFIQKKGWLGVNAFPYKLTEREYKTGFYRSGRKPKELMPLVYKQRADGFFYRDNNALLHLSPEDETTLSTLVKGDAWGDGPKDFMRQIFEGCKDAGKNFFDDYLEPLFYTGLNLNRGDNAFFPPLHRRIPFLNGGLFEEMEGYDWRNNDFRIPNELFSNIDLKGKREADGILDVFDRYNFTMAEDEPMEREVAIDPEMLGKVFENLLDVKDRKSKGAFYTPREIVHYMCQESLINYLVKKTTIPVEDIRKFILFGEYFRDEDTKKTIFVKGENGGKGHMEFDYEKLMEMPDTIFSYLKKVNRLQEIDELLSCVRVVDPAVGSGAFPLGMLTEIVKARETITAYMTIDMNAYQRLSYRSLRNQYRLKRDTIKNSIFACDLEASATDITKLRLWLSLVIDNQIMDQENDEFGYTTKPRELPNLDCNIICGNSLVDEFEGVPLITENAALRNESKGRQMTTFDQSLGILISELIELQSKLYDEKDHVAKEALKNQIQEIYNQIVMEQISSNNRIVDDYYQVIQQASKPFVLWQLYFPNVFRNNGGFDIVIGNPPYVNIVNLEANYRAYLQKHYTITKNKVDLYAYFVEMSKKIINNDGQITFIIPQTWKATDSFEKFRRLIFDNFRLLQVVNLNMGTFDAVVRPVIIQLQSGSTSDYVISIRDDKFKEIDQIEVKEVLQSAHYVLDTESTQTDKKLFRKIERGTKQLGSILQFTRGIKTSNDKRFISSYVKDKDSHPVYRGKNIKAYTLNWKGEYIWYRPDLMREKIGCVPHEKELFEAEEKIICQRVNSSMQLLAAYDKEKNYFLDTTIVSKYDTLVEGYEIKYILGLMNSKLINYWYCFKYRMPTIGLYELHSIPVRPAPAEIQKEICRKVDEILEKTAVKMPFEEIAYDIDEIIFDLYEISQDERNYIRGRI